MLDRFGLLPADIAERHRQAEMIDRHLGVAQALSRALKGIDERCSIVFISDRADPGASNMVPGRWHIRRVNDGTVDSYIPITTADGGYREPTWADLDRLRQRDLRTHFKPPNALEVEAKKIVESEKQREQMKEEMVSNFRAAKRVAGDNLDKRRWGRS